MLESLKEEVCFANQMLPESGLVLLTWGNVSALDRETRLVVIKPSGVDYSKMSPEKMVVTDLSGQVVEGNLKPSSDLPTHLELYRNFQDIGGVTHTHSTWATVFAQAKNRIDCYGTTHADYFFGAVPCTRQLTRDEIQSDYELNTGKVIVETFRDLDYHSISAVLVGNHGPFTWGKNAKESLENALVLEEVARITFLTQQLDPDVEVAPDALIDKHYLRKHGKNAYYGQN